PHPYGVVNRIEPLLATVTAVNEQLAQAKRERALLSMDSKIAEVQAKLQASAATADTSNKALRGLQELKTRIAGQSSVAQILYLQGQGGDAMDDAIALIESASVKAVHQLSDPGDTAKPVHIGQANVPQATTKTTRVVRIADISTKSYLETEADVEAFVSKLKAELLSAVRAGQKARLQ
ncbi:MAG: BREX system P-loop protein BrxC, partial [Rhodoferax sp.]|nr:BREX system P-loop protein BrxC [Rhodoferax sp.]